MAAIRELTVDAKTENVGTVTQFVEEQLEDGGCPVKLQMEINVAIDELFGNIARYAYYPDTGQVTVRVEVKEEPPGAVLTFIDSGKPYDPLAKDDPDITLSAEEREVGGLGIFMVKKLMDSMKYEYRDGQNILEIMKTW